MLRYRPADPSQFRLDDPQSACVVRGRGVRGRADCVCTRVVSPRHLAGKAVFDRGIEWASRNGAGEVAIGPGGVRGRQARLRLYAAGSAPEKRTRHRDV